MENIHEYSLIEMQNSIDFKADYPFLSHHSAISKQFSEKHEDEITMSQALYEMMKKSIPSTMGFLVMRATEIVSYFFIGRMDDPDYIAGVGLGITSASLIWLSMIVGLAGGIETLWSQAFGNKNNYLAGCYYHRAIVITVIMFVIQASILWFSEDILILMGQPPSSSHYAGIFIRIFLPGIFWRSQYILNTRFLNVQGIYYSVLQIQIITFVIHFFGLYLMMNVLQMEIAGIALATDITLFWMFVFQLIWITYFRNEVKVGWWHCFNKDSFTGMYEYLQYGVPSMFMTILEYFYYEILTIISGYLSVNHQSACIIVYNLEALVYFVGLGIAVASANLIGNWLGANQPNMSKALVKASLYYQLINIALVFTIVELFKHQIVSIFTNYDEIKQIVIDFMPWFYFIVVFDILQWSWSGIIRAIGYQNAGTYVNLVAFWVVATPVTFICTFYFDLGFFGVYSGAIPATMIVSISYLFFIYKVNWVQLAKSVHERLVEEQRKLEENHN